MYAIGDYVLNQRTQNIGQVIGYGKQGAPEPTLKVLVAQSANTPRRGFIEEAPCSVWTAWHCPQPNSSYA